MIRYVLFLFGLFVASCSSDNNVKQVFDINNFPQEWVLVTSEITNSMSKSDTLNEQESIVLLSSGRFTKTKETESGYISSEGDFEFVQSDDQIILQLNHDAHNELIINCSDSLIELFALVSDSSLSGGAVPCDGPAVFYQRIK